MERRLGVTLRGIIGQPIKPPWEMVRDGMWRRAGPGRVEVTGSNPVGCANYFNGLLGIVN
jgi:hypothetical protein